jgi:hypothetical protein
MNTIIMLTMNFSSVEILNPISQSSENRWSNVGNKHETYHFTYSNYDLTDLYLNREILGIDIYSNDRFFDCSEFLSPNF